MLLQMLLVGLLALAAGGTVVLVTQRISFASRTAQALSAYSAEPTDVTQHVDINYKLGLVPPAYTPVAYVAAVLVPAGLSMLLGLPLTPALGLGGLGYILAGEFLKGKRRKARLAIEAELPTFVSRLGGMLLVNASPRSALEDVAATLDDSTPLAIWIDEFLSQWREGGAAYLAGAREEAGRISPLLALLVYQIRRLDESGSSGFNQAFATTAKELSTILEVRAVAGSKAEGARTAVLAMLGIMGFMIFMMLSSPSIRQGYRSPEAQMIAVLCFGAMGLGYVFLNSTIDDALEA